MVLYCHIYLVVPRSVDIITYDEYLVICSQIGAHHLLHIQYSSKLQSFVCFSRAPNSCRSQPDLADNQNNIIAEHYFERIDKFGHGWGDRTDRCVISTADLLISGEFLGIAWIARFYVRIANKTQWIGARIDLSG